MRSPLNSSRITVAKLKTSREGNLMADVSGTWLGTYWQEEFPTRFEAALIQSGSALTGRILDDDYLGEAQLTGEVIGRGISFTKCYFTTSPDPVKYVGTVSEGQ
jgi:hypothetical protein